MERQIADVKQAVKRLTGAIKKGEPFAVVTYDSELECSSVFVSDPDDIGELMHTLLRCYTDYHEPCDNLVADATDSDPGGSNGPH